MASNHLPPSFELNSYRGGNIMIDLSGNNQNYSTELINSYDSAKPAIYLGDGWCTFPDLDNFDTDKLLKAFTLKVNCFGFLMWSPRNRIGNWFLLSLIRRRTHATPSGIRRFRFRTHARQKPCQCRRCVSWKPCSIWVSYCLVWAELRRSITHSETCSCVNIRIRSKNRVSNSSPSVRLRIIWINLKTLENYLCVSRTDRFLCHIWAAGERDNGWRRIGNYITHV